MSVKLTIDSTVPVGLCPPWAPLQRRLLDNMASVAELFDGRFSTAEGALRFDGELDDRDGVDDFFECVWNWPLAFILGADVSILTRARRHWAAITEQLTARGRMRDGLEIGYDWYHQGEAQQLFYLLCAALPDDESLDTHARALADVYVRNTHGSVYDPDLNIVLAPHTGSGGALPGLFNHQPPAEWWESMAPYGLPLQDVPGVESIEQLVASPEAQRRMFRAMQERLGSGDVVVNLAITSAVTNAFVRTSDPAYRDWALRYTEGWMHRADVSDGMIPDNAAPDGRVGGSFAGRPFGGHYGWSWPHGGPSVLPAVTIAAINAWNLSGDERFLDFARAQLDLFLARVEHRPMSTTDAPYAKELLDHFSPEDRRSVVPMVKQRLRADGWFESLPVQFQEIAALFATTGSRGDLDRALSLFEAIAYRRDTTRPYRDRQEAGHEQPWLDFLAGTYPDYPHDSLSAALAVTTWRCDLIRQDESTSSDGNIHYLQQHNPVLVEALCHLILGVPPPLYNGGLLQTRVMWTDEAAGRLGLPPDVACLVESVTADTTQVTLINLSSIEPRVVSCDVGPFVRWELHRVRVAERVGGWPGSPWAEAPPDVETTWVDYDCESEGVTFRLAAGAKLQVVLCYRQPSRSSGEEF